MFNKFLKLMISAFFFFTLMGCHYSTRVVHDFWYNRYQMGVWYADQQQWKQAEIYLKKALKKKFKDNDYIHTYDVNYITYFPHRELGVALFHQGKTEKAIKELELSLQFEPSKKTKYYLEKARIKLIHEKQSDKDPPRIKITYPLSNMILSTPIINLHGIATDNTYIQTIYVDKKPVYLNTQKNQIKFCMRQNANMGLNSITVTAEDIMGNVQTEQIHFYVDLLAPVISLVRQSVQWIGNQQYIQVNLHIVDNHLLDFVKIQDRTYPCNKKNNIQIKETILIKKALPAINITARDVAGNINQYQIMPPENNYVLAMNSYEYSASGVLKSINPENRCLWATNAYSGNHTMSPLFVIPQKKYFITKLENTNSNHTTFSFDHIIPKYCHTKTFLIQGKVSDIDGIKSLYLGEEKLDIIQAKECRFKSNFILIDNEINSIVLRAIDIYDNETLKELTIEQRPSPMKFLKNRAILKIKNISFLDPYGLIEIPKRRQFNYIDWPDIFKTKLSDAIIEKKRFQIYKDIASKKYDYSLTVRIEVREIKDMKYEINSFVYLYNDQNQRVAYITAFQLFSRKLSDDFFYIFENMAKDIDQHLRQEMPLIETYISNRQKNNIEIPAGIESNIKELTKLIVYKNDDHYRHQTISEAFISQVLSEKSYIKKTYTNHLPVLKGHMVIVK